MSKINVVISEQEAGITIKEFQEYQNLNRKLMGDNSFVVPDNTPEWERFNTLSIKVNHYYKKTRSCKVQ